MNKKLFRRAFAALTFFIFHSSFFISCSPEPPLHLYDAQEIEMEMPVIDLNLDVFWDYETDLGIDYNWRAEWYYGWDDTDRELFGELGYTMPKVFNLRRYYTASTPYAPHTGVVASTVEGTSYRERYNWATGISSHGTRSRRSTACRA